MNTVVQTRVKMLDGEEWFSTEPYKQVETKLRSFVTEHMPLNVVVAMHEATITVNRSAVSTASPV